MIEIVHQIDRVDEPGNTDDSVLFFKAEEEPIFGDYYEWSRELKSISWSP